MENIINESQRLAIEHINGPMMVLAGPGSGKTFVITRRLKYMIKELGILPESILVITFAKAAALEMQQRFENLMEGEYAPVNFGTFHAIYFNILKNYYHYDFSNIINEKEKYNFMKLAISNFNQNDNQNDNQIIDESIISMLISDISKFKNMNIKLTDFIVEYIDKSFFDKIYKSYDSLMKEANKIDFDDMVLLCRDLFCNNNNILKKWQNCYNYILIDEFQDINKAQYDVIKMLLNNDKNLFVVGDDDQSIYGFRGSCPSIMLNFNKDFPTAKKILLDVNYRCSQDIVNKSLSFIENNKNRYQKKIKANNKSGKKVQLFSYENGEKEYKEIIKMIKTLKRNGNYKDIAIIYRTNRKARFLIKLLNDNKIPFYFKEKPKSFFDSYISKDILAMISFASGNNSRANFIRFMNKPLRYISRNILDEKVDFNILKEKAGNKIYLLDNLRKLEYDLNRIKNMDIYMAINYIRKAMLYEDYVIKTAKEKHEDIAEIRQIFELLQTTSKSIDSYKNYLKLIEEYDNKLEKSARNTDEDAINILTMHGSKGLEFKTVIIPDLNEGYLPQTKAKSREEIEEERRVFYVAMTRAKENLVLMHIEKNQENRQAKSRFLDQIKNLKSDS